MKKILVVAAYPDCEILVCGGTIVKHVSNKDNVDVLQIFPKIILKKNV
mgnify:CR=1 FL=1|tara:strand:- start:342 stop:485 length:144 start_codon:yes stop_codon:yes gene_type:complete